MPRPCHPGPGSICTDSLAATGRGHGSHKALMLGLEGETAEATDIDRLPARIAAITAARRLTLLGQHAIPFDPAADLIFEHRERLPGHPNGMRFIALADDSVLEDRIYYSVGGGFVASADDAGRPLLIERDTPLPLPFTSAETLLALCERHGLAISDVMLRNERAWRPEAGRARRLVGDLGGDAAVRHARLRAGGTAARATGGAARGDTPPAADESAGRVPCAIR